MAIAEPKILLELVVICSDCGGKLEPATGVTNTDSPLVIQVEVQPCVNCVDQAVSSELAHSIIAKRTQRTR